MNLRIDVGWLAHPLSWVGFVVFIVLISRLFSFRACHIPILEYIGGMARSPTTADAFNAVAEPRRRQILDLLASGERPVNELVESLGLTQPQVSKHLRVLKEVGLVSVRDAGRQRLYRLNADRLKPIHDWVKAYERFWTESFDRLAEYLDEIQSQEKLHERAD
jgi:DNA-binding transcriptional ArsR family regulator